jgi:PAS domain S-box-containing protein
VLGSSIYVFLGTSRIWDESGEEPLVMNSTTAALASSYEYTEVARSAVIAVASSYVALDLAGRATTTTGRARLAWLGSGATAMGVGVWTMHLKGMLAFQLPVPVEYHWPTLVAALLVAILASWAALCVSSRQKMRRGEALTAGVVMGGGIVGLHYLCMAAMRLPAITRFSPVLVAFSVLIAILFSLIALVMAFGLREENRWSVPRRLGSALVMGVAVSGMHYTDMAATTFIPGPPPDLSHAVSISPFGNSGVVIVTLILLVGAIITSSVERRAGAEIQGLNQDLERRVVERTLLLETINQALRKEIAERERAEEAVRESEDRLRLVIETIPQQIWSGPPDGSLDFCNAQWRSYMGLTQRELQGEGWQSMLHPHDRQRVLNAWHESVANGTFYEQEERHRQFNGQYRWFLVRGVPLRDSSGGIVRWYGTNTDIQDRKETEDRLQKAQENLARVARVVAMGELAAAIAHEVNQPLAAIVTNASFCIRHLASASQNSEQLRDAIAEIVDDGTRASTVISRIRALLQKSPPERIVVDINQIIQEVTTLLLGELTRNGVSWRTDLAADLPHVLGDRILLQQVLINLIMNGIEAMPSTTTPRELLVKSAKNHNEVSVQVQDSGTGLDPQRAEHIFEPFFTTKPGGIGMGLSIARSIVESHGGRLSAENRPEGALFQFTLPRR